MFDNKPDEIGLSSEAREGPNVDSERVESRKQVVYFITYL